MKRALFIVSEQGNGHRVRCGALAEELRGRGWECEDAPHYGMASATAFILDGRIDYVIGAMPLVRIVDEPAPKQDAALLVCGSAGATPEMFADSGAGKVLAGPDYALLRPVFREWCGASVKNPFDWRMTQLDLRTINGIPPMRLAALIAEAHAHGAEIMSYGGMRALEAACVMGPARSRLYVVPRNEGERLNAEGLKAGAVVDGLGTKRVADEIEALFS